MKIFCARIRGVGEPAQPGETTFTDEKTKYTEAAQHFSDVAKNIRTRVPASSRRILRRTQHDERLDKNDEAKKWLQGLADGSDYDLAAMARFELAQMHDRAGQSDEAVKLYKDLIAKPSVLVPKPVDLLLTLARDITAPRIIPRKPPESYHSQIKTEYPDTPIAQQADQELNLLPGKS